MHAVAHSSEKKDSNMEGLGGTAVASPIIVEEGFLRRPPVS